MNDFTFVLLSLKSRWMNSTLSVLLTAFGVMLALLIVQFGHHIQNRLNIDGQGIDIVVGAKGSPLQLILSSVYHVDIPTGNISYDEAQKWMKHPQIKTAIPLALGDNWKGFRIVGTTPAYMSHYKARLSKGHIWDNVFEAVVGSSVGLKVGDQFVGTHGLMMDGHSHEEEHYRVTGVMSSTGTVLDRLILTSLDSVMKIHGLDTVGYKNDEEYHGDDHDHHHEHHHEHDDHHDHKLDGKPEITALLMTTKSPIANINLPNHINRESMLQAANPALEMARLTSMLGVGVQSLTLFSAILIMIASLSIFVGLAGSLENRMGDLAVLRAIGYSKRRVFKIIILESVFVIIGGVVLGFVLELGGFLLFSDIVPLGGSGSFVVFHADFVLIILFVLLAGLLAAILPAWRASQVDVAKQLTRT